MRLPGKLSGSHPLAGWLNQLRDFAASCQLTSVVGGRFSQGANGTQLFVAPGGGSGGKGLALNYCTFVSMGSALITVRPSDGNVDGSDDFQIAKPYKLRFTITSQTIDSVQIDYTYNTTGNYCYINQRRTATVHADTPTEDQVIIPRYLVGDPIYYVTGVTTGVLNGSSVDYGKLDINVDGRAWGKVYAAA